MDKEELKNLSDQLRDMQMRAKEREARPMLNAIKDEINKRNTVPESVFQTYFLDTFIRYIRNKGTLQGTEEQINKDDYNLRKWLEISQGPYGEVDVIRDGTDEVVVTVPSMYMPQTNVIENLENFSFNAMAKSCQQLC